MRWILACSCLLALGCARRPAEAPRDVLVVLLDALRADALGCYGAGRDTSPALDAFAARGLRVEGAFASASYTLASVASLFTGERPAAHRVLGLATNVLPPSLPTLAQACAEAGFATAGFSSNPHVVEAGGFGRGFERFEYLPRDRFDLHSVPASVSTEFLGWWRSEAARPRFAYVHVLPPHQPYDPPPPFDQRFGAGAVPRELGLTDRLTALQQARGAADDPLLLAQIRARYDANVAYADAWFGELLQTLELEPGASQRLTLVLGDHGEGFGEHGDILHGANPFAEMTRVPLLLAGPGLIPGVVPGVFSLADLPATLGELLGVPWPGPGRSAAAELRAGRLDPDREALSRSMGQRPLWALRRGDWTFVQQPGGDFSALFLRSVDPLEQLDRSPAEPAQAAELRLRLEALLTVDQAAAAGRPAPRRHSGDQGALRALGYLGD
jgi:arylsulfatase A-like enzyme